ncbi:MAG: Chaperone protein ClpB [Parcubacteria group bacterium GW2011_GWA1_38_7]|nr:MAG: Chaperone protein ClpB [Parcubacteria group bacterium GW2011_GWA1_38_7]
MYIDTNIILRAILNDHKTLSPKAQKFFRLAKKRKTKLNTTDLVIGEIFWVLESKKIEPKLSRKKAADIILSFVNLPRKINEEVINFLVEKGSDPEFGGRSVNRAIQDKIENLVARKIVSGETLPGSKIEIKKEELL